MSGNVEAAEVAKFGRLAARWWDPRGPMRPLHAMNPARVAWICARVERAMPVPARVLDLGCGAGLAAEAMARRGHEVLGVDASAEAIAAGRAHAEAEGVTGLSYRVGAAEALVAEGASFDVVTALEVIEHVPDQAGFLRLIGRLARPGGLVFVSTLNRTVASLAVAKIGAEYVARVLPAGTHDWRRFVPPEALAGWARDAGLVVREVTGLSMNLATGGWRASGDVSVNYLAMFERV